MVREAFLTGSHVYGTPNEDSDIDLVIFCDPQTKKRLVEFSKTEKWKADERSVNLAEVVCADDPNIHIRFGKLNIIACTLEESYEVWDTGTTDLEILSTNERRPIGREEALQHFNKLREAAGIDDDYCGFPE